MKTILTITSVLLLTACGGGGSGGGSAPAPTPTDSVLSSSTTVSELNVPDGFDYRTQAATNLDVTLSSLPDGEHYLSLYSRYQRLDNGSLQPDRSSKLLGARLTDRRLNTDIVLPSAVTALLLEIWTRGEVEPVHRLVSIGETELIGSPLVVAD